jgi:hypothetical protein
MSRLIPEGFLTIRQAAERLAVAMYSGVPDGHIVEKLRKSGLDVADGAAIEHAIDELWSAVDERKIRTFVLGATRRSPLKLSPEMSKGIPILRSPRGGDLYFLRPGSSLHTQFVSWFGPDLCTIMVVFKEVEIRKLARTLLRARRRREALKVGKKVGRPSRRAEAEPVIREMIDQGHWSPTQSVKALTSLVNRRGSWINPLSDDTVRLVLDELHKKTGDRRFERLQRQRLSHG